MLDLFIQIVTIAMIVVLLLAGFASALVDLYHAIKGE